jgi:hypothetical protein
VREDRCPYQKPDLARSAASDGGFSGWELMRNGWQLGSWPRRHAGPAGCAVWKTHQCVGRKNPDREIGYATWRA